MGQRVSTVSWLRMGVGAGPFYLALGIGQGLLRDGFDFGRHSLSVLANGTGGWMQTANFIVSGLLVVGAAIGIGRALRPHSRMAGPILACFGLGMLVAAVFAADPVDGFPPGTPLGNPTSISARGMVHFVAGATGFLALAASCVAVGLALFRRKQPGMGALSMTCGASVVVGFMLPGLLPASGPVAGIWGSVVIGWTWLSVLCLRLISEATHE